MVTSAPASSKVAAAAASATIFRSIAHTRRSCKRFQPHRSIPGETMTDILQSTLRSPSSFNLQPTQLILVQNQTIKDKLANTAMLGAGNQYRTRDCSALAVFLSDLEASERIQRIHQLETQARVRHPNYLALFPISTAFFLGEGHAATLLKQITTDFVSHQFQQPMPKLEPIQAWSYKNTALTVQTYVLASTSHDLATVIMEGLDARKMSDILNIPDRYAIPMVVATGYEYEEDSQTATAATTPRLNIEEVVFEDSFGVPWKVDGEEEPNDAVA